MKIGEAPLLGLAQNLHPLDNAPAERTTIKHLRRNAKVLYYYYNHSDIIAHRSHRLHGFFRSCDVL